VDPEKNKDVGCTLWELVDSEPDGFYDTLMICVNNAYPSYFSEVKAEIFNGCARRVRITKVEIFSDEELDVSINNLSGYILKPNRSVTATVFLHVNEEALENMVYKFRVKIFAKEAYGYGLGWWKNWDKHKTFTQNEIENWLCEIDSESLWLGPVNIEEFLRYLEIHQNTDTRKKFLAHYLVLWLNVKASFLNLSQTFDVRAYDPYNYLMLANPEQATLEEIILAIESKYNKNPSSQQFLLMKDICEAINELRI
jgi:hypothetical protein